MCKRTLLFGVALVVAVLAALAGKPAAPLLAQGNPPGNVTNHYQIDVLPKEIPSCSVLTGGLAAMYRGTISGSEDHGWSIYFSEIWFNPQCCNLALGAHVQPDGTVVNPNPDAIRITSNRSVGSGASLCGIWQGDGSIYRDSYRVNFDVNSKIYYTINGQQLEFEVLDTDVFVHLYLQDHFNGVVMIPGSEVNVVSGQNSNHNPGQNCSLSNCSGLELVTKYIGTAPSTINAPYVNDPER